MKIYRQKRKKKSLMKEASPFKERLTRRFVPKVGESQLKGLQIVKEVEGKEED
jgi:hypothetical protein